MDSSHIHEFLNYLGSFYKIPKELEEYLRNNSVYRKIEKGEIFIRKEAYDKKVGFLSEGIMRIYDIDKQGQHWNKVLLTYQTLLLGNTEIGQPSIHYIDAITDCHTVELPISILAQALNDFSELREVRAKITSKIYQMKSERESDLLLLGTKERFLKLKEQIGEKMDQIPQYHIASYLGVTPIQLSRIKSSLTS